MYAHKVLDIMSMCDGLKENTTLNCFNLSKSLNEKDYYTFWIVKYDHDSSYVSPGLPDNKDCSLITKIQKVDKYPTLNQVTN